jgi:monoamine oxidase
LAELSSDEIVAHALYSLGLMFHKDTRELRELLVAAYHHDWNGDRLSRGAYSYTPAGMTGAGSELSKPVQKTLFFAGEATNSQGEQGTVHAALMSGQLAANAILRSFNSNSVKGQGRPPALAAR